MSDNTNFNTIKNEIVNTVANLGVLFSYDEEKNVIHYTSSVDCAINKVINTIIIRESGCSFYTIIPVRVDINNPEMTEKITDFICRSNFKHNNSVFDIDFSDGELSCKYFLEYEDSMPSEKAIEEAIFCNRLLAEQSIDAIAEIIFKNISVDDAMKKCEEKLFKIFDNALN